MRLPSLAISNLLPLPTFFLLASLSQHAVITRAQQLYSISSLDSMQVENLMPACESVYTQLINGCVMADFISINPCSSACITDLQSIQMEAQTACQGNDIPTSSMLAYFTDGKGVDQLCTVMKMVGTNTISAAGSRTPNPSTAPASAGSTTPPPNNGNTGSAATTSAAPTAAPAQSRTVGMSHVALIGAVVGLVVGCMLLAVAVFALFRHHYKE